MVEKKELRGLFRRVSMKNEISKVDKGSIAEELGVEIGDRLISINGTEVKDILDYRFLMSDDFVVMELEKTNLNEIWELEVEKDFNENFGIEFKDQIMDEAKSCRNNCIFCFIDQLPKGMRKSLYFKDDDSRLSFLQGNFVTLTNLKEEDIDRIIKYKISPINISVHTTNPELRVKMLNNRFAGNILERLQRLSDGGITMNCQIVMCPGVNDGIELENTVKDLYKFYPHIKNVAGVPVGVTKFRDGLFNMKIYDQSSSEKQILLMESMQKKFMKEIDEPFIRLSDEFYVLAKKDVPEKEFYKDFEQLEDGIGMIRVFRENIKETIKNLNMRKKGCFTIVTGVSAYNEIKVATDAIAKESNKLKIETIRISNKYFGETITVAGLLTATDIIGQLKDKNIGEYIILPNNMLKVGTNIFLDDLTVKDIENELNRKVLICDYTGEDLVQIINEYSEEDN
jgi:putative radical SAM enzyme (TIGR03279 family)